MTYYDKMKDLDKILKTKGKDHLKKNFLLIPRDFINKSCIVIWQVEDVTQQAADRGIKISEDEAQEIIERMEDKHDCSIGITWDTIDYYLDMYLEEHPNSQRFICEED